MTSHDATFQKFILFIALGDDISITSENFTDISTIEKNHGNVSLRVISSL